MKRILIVSFITIVALYCSACQKSGDDLGSAIKEENVSDDVSCSVINGGEVETVNIAHGKSYIIKINAVEFDYTINPLAPLPAEEYSDLNFTKLTDDAFSKGRDINEYGMQDNVSACFAIGTATQVELVLDLGEEYSGINSLVIRNMLFRNGVNDNKVIEEVRPVISLSDKEGEGVAVQAHLEKKPLEGAPKLVYEGVGIYDYIFTFDEACQGRYVTIAFVSPAFVLQLDEIEVWADVA